MSIQYGPILHWPGNLKTWNQRTKAPFKSGYDSTIRLVERELRAVSAQSPVIQLAIEERYWRIDGKPYATAKASHPGVILSFSKSVKRVTGNVRMPLSFPCDTYQTWESNLRAIALGMEALRRVDRYGITSNGEQYLGFKALPPPGPSHEDMMTVEDAARFVFSFSAVADSEIIRNGNSATLAYRIAAAKLHPDANGGVQTGNWAKLQGAKSLLDAHHATKRAT